MLSEDPVGDIAELCYIPTLGGGFGFTWSEVERWPLSRKKRMLEWLFERREREAKALGGKGSTGRGNDWAPPPNLPSGPTLSGPAVP